ncbi:MAG: hypothetical protein IIA87_03690 [Nanoarchaeota archaeon]|nr:hypothetical protein [Nanoarchaeota archaeon]
MVNKDTLLADILYFIKNDLINNITDPISSKRSSKSKFVLTSYPNRPVDYPIITIKAINIEAVRSGMQTTAQDTTITLEIRVWARNEKEKDGLYDDVMDRLFNIQFTNSGSTENALHDLTTNNPTEIDEEGESGGQVIKSRLVNIQYKFWN